MSSTSFNVGISSETKMSSRVLKPPGGGHSNIFAPPEERTRAPRPKNNQQNSEMMCEIMGKRPEAASEKKFTQEPSANGDSAPATTPEAVSKPIDHTPVEGVSKSSDFFNSAPAEKSDNGSGRIKVPPGGFSSGFW